MQPLFCSTRVIGLPSRIAMAGPGHRTEIIDARGGRPQEATGAPTAGRHRRATDLDGRDNSASRDTLHAGGKPANHSDRSQAAVRLHTKSAHRAIAGIKSVEIMV